MTKCDDCGLEMQDMKSCTLDGFIFDGITYARSRFHFGERDGYCNDCAIPHGGIHHWGCDVERCPKCRGQLISCGCFEEDRHHHINVVKLDIPADERRCTCGHFAYIHDMEGGCKNLVEPNTGVSKDHYTNMVCPCGEFHDQHG